MNREDYIDPMYSEVANTRRERATVNVALLSQPGQRNPSCRICHVTYISQENGTIFFCPSCGEKVKAVEAKFESKVKALYGPSAKTAKELLVSQTQQQRRKKKQDTTEPTGELTHEELTQELGFEPTKTVS